ncbi:MAG TPA: MltA domain-containing protein [Alphaproteobacteria bacterium]|nr:MltA domain-containing protein [Alphaproteobacteria bacterium]
MRGLIILLFGVLLLGLGLAGIGLVGLLRPPAPKAAELVLTPVRWSDLEGWRRDDPRPALAAFRRSCVEILKKPPATPMGGQVSKGIALYRAAGDWEDVCGAAEALNFIDANGARDWFERYFLPYAASNSGERGGLFTGYFEPELAGSLTRTADFTVPLLKRPDDLVSVDLGEFRDSLKGQRIAGRVTGGQLHPYSTREQIRKGALDDEKLALAWVKDPVDAFFMQIQGSGRIRLADGSILRLGYDAQNGWPYVAIGRVLRDMRALDRGEISMRTIKAWLESHPDDAATVMDENTSYIFFKPLNPFDSALGPIGAQNVPLVPGRSLAVDLKFHALGVPVWLDSTLPLDEAGTPGQLYRRLMIAQDTGGAITGPVRGDVFFGSGAEAQKFAGRMKQIGEMYVLLPRSWATAQ